MKSIFAFTDIYTIFNCFCACNNLNYRDRDSVSKAIMSITTSFIKQVCNSAIRLGFITPDSNVPRVITRESLHQTAGVSGLRPWLWSVFTPLSSSSSVTDTNFFIFSVPLQMSGSSSSQQTCAE